MAAMADVPEDGGAGGERVVERARRAPDPEKRGANGPAAVDSMLDSALAGATVARRAALAGEARDAAQQEGVALT